MENARARFDRLVGQYAQDVYRFAYWLCGNQHQAEELAQETFLRAWKSIDSLQEAAAAKSWLFTIVRREHARSFERKRFDLVDDPDFDRLEATRTDYDTSTEAFVLRRALEQLPVKYREPLVLQVVGGYSTEEIADQLGIKAGAVMTRLFRARQKLREMLGERAD
ncbi:MAG TPA: sigma-70 family RNA polymerase sigma factor [Gammaproteobacteria bacterium]